MIKIDLSSNDISKIEHIFLNDMQTQKTGLFKVLETEEAKKVLQGKPQYQGLYTYLYDTSGAVNRKNVKALLIADRKSMETYIARFNGFNHNDSKELTDTIFRYDTFSSRKCAYDILKIEDISVCPYCNRQYIFTLHHKKVRPQFDHYFPKSMYPYLAVSIFNLIPSCSICNQAKHTLDTFKEPILYPFEEEFGDQVRFKIDGADFKQWQGITDNFKVKIDSELAGTDQQSKVKRQNNNLHLEIFYEKHKDYVKDIAWNHHINTDERIEEIMKVFPGMFRTKEEVISTVYMNDIRKDRLGKRPLAKLTRDIYEALS